MKYFGLIIASLTRNPLRLGLTASSLVVAFLLFGLLEPIAQIFESDSQIDGESRLWVTPRHSISDMLPVYYAQQVEQVPGVAIVAHQTWFGGTFRDRAQSGTFTRWAITPKTFMQLNTQLIIPDDQLNAFINTRTGVIVGRSTADRYGLTVGDKIPVTADIWHKKDGSLWEFDLVGIYDGKDDNVDTSRLFINYEYFDEGRIVGKGIVSNVVFSIVDSRQTSAVAATIDTMFANSAMETITTTEREYILNQARQLGNIGLIVRSVTAAVLFTILLLTANTMSQAIRERSHELAVLKTLGFQNIGLLLIVLAESLLLTLLSASFGLALAAFLLPLSSYIIPQLSSLYLDSQSLLLGLSIAFTLGIIVGLPPALRAMQIKIVDAFQHL